MPKPAKVILKIVAVILTAFIAYTQTKLLM